MNSQLDIPKPEVTQEEMNEWFELQKQIGELNAKEMQLRKKIFSAYFPNPVEGTNVIPLTKGWVLKATYKINRTVDIAALTALEPELIKLGIPCKDLIRYKAELSTTEYRKLQTPENADKLPLFDQVLTIKVGSPSLEIVLPKRAV